MGDARSLAQGNLAYRRPELYDRLTADDGVVERVVRIVGTGEPRTILDLGCGTGRHLAALRTELGASVVGVDLQEQMVDYGRRSHDVDLRVGDLRQVRLGRRFDLLICLGNSLAYLRTDADLMAAAATFASHAHPMSMLVISTLVTPIVKRTAGSVRIACEDVAATVEIETTWEPVRHVQVTRRRWVHDDGGVDVDELKRRIYPADVLKDVLAQAGFHEVRQVPEDGAEGWLVARAMS